MLTRQLPSLQDFDREEALTQISPLSKTHILQAHKEFDGIEKKNTNHVLWLLGQKS